VTCKAADRTRIRADPGDGVLDGRLVEDDRLQYGVSSLQLQTEILQRRPE